MYSAQGIFQHNFQCKKVHTILNKMWYAECHYAECHYSECRKIVVCAGHVSVSITASLEGTLQEDNKILALKMTE
jgi:hypothetical protein